MAILHRPRAEEDLIDIYLYVAEDDEAAAVHLLDGIHRSLRNLSTHPLIGRARPELAAGLRSFPVGHYIVFYCPAEDGIEIVRVLSHYMDIGPDDLI